MAAVLRRGGLGAILAGARGKMRDIKIEPQIGERTFVATIAVELPQGKRGRPTKVDLLFEHHRADLDRSPIDGDWKPRGEAATQVAIRPPAEWTFGPSAAP